MAEHPDHVLDPECPDCLAIPTADLVRQLGLKPHLGPTIADEIGAAITRSWEVYNGREEILNAPGEGVDVADANRILTAQGRLLGLAQALAIIRTSPNKPTAAHVKAIAEEFRPA